MSNSRSLSTSRPPDPEVNDFDPEMLTKIERENILLVVSAPSGAGKSTVCGRVIDELDDVVFSVSTTTREPRVGEVDGEDYHFVDDDTFDRMIDQDEFLEWAHVHGARYGTSREAVSRQLEGGRDVLLDIDVQGASRIKDIYSEAVMVFIAPPSMDELENRLRNRGTETEQQIQERLKNARQELELLEMYDYIVINDSLDQAVLEFKSILRSEKNRLFRILDSL